ncbi:hypothetical protein I302_105176 [Kwoniella bestiolae CBS 10118]|uniref:MaoC-like domain-containing protein n=1 Tax=Kwoniella bestiolae CBS 10118 TaxID=1296100 RepID=A0A1B9FSD6_9TREE|nr:hypothetical protein I302_08464 [Kwoniella bestiolae CBS 10118]OCF21687.1 hypothetical protein I302_08464 [Kwoniella bestiolae CBS 10118]
MILLLITTTSITFLLYLYHLTLRALTPLLTESSETKLDFPTRELSGTRVTVLLLYHIARSTLRRIGIGSPLSVNHDGTQHTLDKVDSSLSMPFLITSSDIQTYIQCISATPITHDQILSNPYHLQLLLSALTEPSMLLLLSKVNCPIDPVGSVNVRNRFELLDPSLCQKSLEDSIQGKKVDLVARSRLDKDVKKVKRGWEFTIIVELLFKGEAIYRQEFTSLQFHKHPVPPGVHNRSQDIAVEPIGEFSIGEKEPSTWAKLSKDYNPIHTSDIAARLLGFRKKIAHGNHVVAKAIYESSDKLRAMEVGKGKKIWMEVELKRPITIPSELEIKVSDGGSEKGKQYMEIWLNGKVATSVTCGI